jgi:hypothetical protein
MPDKNDIVMIELDRPRMLWFGHKALKKLGALTGKSLDQMDFENFDSEQIEKILYCGLITDAKAHNEVLKLEDMEDLLDMVPFNEIIEKMGKAFNASFGIKGGSKNFQGIADKNQS